MKKRIVIILIVIGLLAVLFTPIPTGVYKDGGTRVYSALTYKIVDWNRLTGESTYSKTRVYFFPNNFRTIDDLWWEEGAEHRFSFIAKVLEINDSRVLVEVTECDWPSFKIGDIVSCGTKQLENVDVNIGSIVKITFNGFVEETYPPQIGATDWQVYDGEYMEYSFIAEILEIDKNSVLVKPISGDNISGVDKVAFKTANLPKIDIKVGSKIKVTYNGQVMYSYPAQINALSWQLCE